MQSPSCKIDIGHLEGAKNWSTWKFKATLLLRDLKAELMKIDKSELPDILLICKILDTLPEAYFSFKSSWMMLSMTDKTVENLTTQLCAYERSLSIKNEGSAEALALQKNYY
ncbi:unnamed protein product [Euphydryas editha]|uniref:Retrovirus-related Pol polyprotein from transposon TNT 1-94 n=1 Tax=Euphydryas editha TaxID=104508 RepID=A0AAU9VD93_EUPED|nr:unnamed protein product [Euphydryas editha]